MTTLAGLVPVQERAVGALAEARRLATPASVGLADTSLGREDAASFAPEAAERLHEGNRMRATAVRAGGVDNRRRVFRRWATLPFEGPGNGR